MRVKVEESYPGEFQKGKERLREMLQAGFERQAQSLCGCGEHTDAPLIKALARGGEVKALEELSELLAEPYRRRLKMLEDDVMRAALGEK